MNLSGRTRAEAEIAKVAKWLSFGARPLLAGPRSLRRD